MKVHPYVLDCSTGCPSFWPSGEDECCLLSEWRFDPLEMTGHQPLPPAGQELGESLNVRPNRDLTDHRVHVNGETEAQRGRNLLPRLQSKSPEGTLKISSSPTDVLQQVSPQASSTSAQDGTIRPTLTARRTAATGRCREVGTKGINSI